MKELPQLPVGHQYFSNLRQNKEIYIDKTMYIYEFCQRKTAFYFLSRPRRFGKSLLLDTIGELFVSGRYDNYWFQTGTPSFLVRLLSKRFEYQLEEKEVSDFILDNFVLEQQDELDLDSLLLQTGFLTIKTVTNDKTFILNYPNQEVKQAFSRFLLSEYEDDLFASC